MDEPRGYYAKFLSVYSQSLSALVSQGQKEDEASVEPRVLLTKEGPGRFTAGSAPGGQHCFRLCSLGWLFCLGWVQPWCWTNSGTALGHKSLEPSLLSVSQALGPHPAP